MAATVADAALTVIAIGSYPLRVRPRRDYHRSPREAALYGRKDRDETVGRNLSLNSLDDCLSISQRDMQRRNLMREKRFYHALGSSYHTTSPRIINVNLKIFINELCYHKEHAQENKIYREALRLPTYTRIYVIKCIARKSSHSGRLKETITPLIALVSRFLDESQYTITFPDASVHRDNAGNEQRFSTSGTCTWSKRGTHVAHASPRKAPQVPLFYTLYISPIYERHVSFPCPLFQPVIRRGGRRTPIVKGRPAGIIKCPPPFTADKDNGRRTEIRLRCRQD